jgi:hypothetical protein
MGSDAGAHGPGAEHGNAAEWVHAFKRVTRNSPPRRRGTEKSPE